MKTSEMTPAQSSFLYFMLFAIGIIVGRLIMAIQYAVMKASSRRKL